MSDKLKPVSKTISGRVVSVTPLPARLALQLQFRLLRLLGQPVISLLKGPVSDLLRHLPSETLQAGTLGVADVVKALGDLSMETISELAFNNLDPEALTNLMLDVLASTRVDNHELTEGYVNLEFAGDTCLLWKFFTYALEVNYKDFLGLMPTMKAVGKTVQG